MPTPTERLETRKQRQDCRVCAWLVTLDEKSRREWAQAISNPRFGAALVADEITVEATAASYAGQSIGESSVDSHRKRGHR